MMSGIESTLDVYLGKHKVAELSLFNDELHWTYTTYWQRSGYALSPHLPLQEDIPPINVQRFLRNYLPEGNGFEILLSAYHLSKNNTFGLMQVLGLDINGGLMILPSQQLPPDSMLFREIAEHEMIQRLESYNRTELVIWDGKPRLSVAGVQDKINVVVTEDGRIGLGDGSLCSTHIMKFEMPQTTDLMLNEYISMRLAKYCGLNVADVQLIHYGKYSVLLIKRFDREYLSIDNVKRRHLIDGCQALNLPPEYKYERNFGSSRDVAQIREGASLNKLFDFTNQCVNPALSKLQLLNWCLFNILICNFDAHGKNISFYVDSKGLSLAPFYDLVNIELYPEYEHELAMAIGDEFDINSINAYQLADFAETCQLSRSLVTNKFNNILQRLNKALAHEMSHNEYNESQLQFLTRYSQKVAKRCEYFQTQLPLISSIAL